MAHGEVNVVVPISRRLKLVDMALKPEDEGMRMSFALTCTTSTRDDLIESLLELEAVEDVRVNE